MVIIIEVCSICQCCICGMHELFILMMIIIYNYIAEITTSTIDMKDESRGRPIQKAKVSYY